ncbi:type IV secretion system protein VirB3 [Allorhizobium sonneratiae]|uniref:type IV secretion system protein VirB3 n=1 Tax=Allorhizobium sonneratiae TaxID=2934936 RepID=UPI003B84517D
MIKDQEKPHTNSVVIGLTADPNIFGIPYSAFIVIFLITFVAWIDIKSFYCFFISPVIYFLLLIACTKDKNIINIFVVYVSKISISQNKSFWGGNSYGA